jgi:diguanylate cyclase (GGDEF)-like protein
MSAVPPDPAPPADPAPSEVEKLAGTLDALEAQGGPDLAAVTEVERAAAALGATELRMRARLLQADRLDREGEPTAGARVAWEINQWAAEHQCPAVLARSHRLLALIHHNLGDPAACLDHALRGVELLDDTAPPALRASHLRVLGHALSWAGSFEAARARYRAAEQLFVGLGDVDGQLAILNNLAYNEYLAGEPERAWAAAERMTTLAAEHDRILGSMCVDTKARALIGLDRHAEAERLLVADLAEPAGHGQADGLAETLLTLCVAQRRQGGLDRAQATLTRCRELCDERQLAEIRVRVQREQAELYAQAGDFERAYELYQAFHADTEALRSEQREAQARTRQALFETTEARQEAERFRELALHDPLTGLRNRRYVDEQLPGLFRHAARTAAPLILALVDLDHFKRINDQLSHDVGDRVLVAVATLLSTGAGGISDTAFVARMGGEEFLLVLPGVELTAAMDRLDLLRAAVCGHPWREVTGELPVTVSVGVTAARAADTQPAALARADRHLYQAKHAGRDRVVGDPDPTSRHRRTYRDRLTPP